jgi:hypothetical protein
MNLSIRTYVEACMVISVLLSLANQAFTPFHVLTCKVWCAILLAGNRRLVQDLASLTFSCIQQSLKLLDHISG